MASELNTPPVLLKPFADSGDKNTIPETATGTQQASLDEGFPPVTSLPLTQGGIPPERKDFNGLGNLLSKQYFYLQNGGRFTFNQAVSDAIGGYPQNATLWFKDEALGINYPVTSLINNNTYNFVTTPSYIDGVKWKRVIDSFPSTQISNCLTEIPQDIKLELNNGTLTLKSGSKITKLDGTPVNITADRSVTISVVDTKWFVYCSNAGTSINNYSRVDKTGSGSSLPANNTTYNYFYNTTENKIYAWVSGAWSEQTISFPLCIVTTSGGAITSIDQVFNGFGYIGSTMFALPGVKGLIPNGRNTDGTLKNIEYTIPSVKIFNFAYSNQHDTPLVLTKNVLTANKVYAYNEKTNHIYNSNIGTIYSDRFICGRIATNSSSQISLLEVKTAFHAVDYNDFSDLSDKVDTNISNITILQNTKQDVATAVNYDNITNCITEIPQDIKLELNNGTLTLKAGSKVYVPNGANTFDEVIINSDKSGYGTLAHTRPCFMVYSTISQNIERLEVEKSYSGTTDPVSGTWHIWYDTANNICYMVSNTGVQTRISLPLAIVTFAGDGTTTITSIDQVFNGFGYIGSTIFALPNVKGLIPNGRNADGSLKSTERTLQSVNTNTIPTAWGNIGAMKIIWWSSGLEAQPVGRFSTNKKVTATSVYSYVEDDNIWSYTNNSGTTWLDNRAMTIVADINFNGTSITLFTSKTAFHAVDYNDFEKAMLKEDWVKVSTVPASPDSSKFYYIPEN